MRKAFALTRRPGFGYALSGVILLVVLAILFLPLLTTHPSQLAVERDVRRALPPGHDEFKVTRYDQAEGGLVFEVTYREYGDLLGVRYKVSRWYDSIGTRGWRVHVEGRRPVLGRPHEQWLMVDVTYDARGKLVAKGKASAAGPTEGPMLEERAKQIAMAVHEAF